MTDIKRLLNKKGWTGRELGILELSNMAVMFRQALEGKEPQPLVEQAQFRKMINTITDRQQGQVYNGYISIHEWLSIRYNIAQTQLQQAQLQYRTLVGYITDATLAEDVYRYIEQLPVIMTEKQYRDAREAGLKKWLYDEDGTERGDSLAALIERGISFYTKQLQTNPAKPNPLKAIRKKYIAEPVKSKLILEGYNEVMGEGYYTIEDGSGRRSDTMTAEEWQEAIITPAMKQALRDMKTADGSGTEYTQQIATRRLLDRAKVIFEGGTERDADEAQHKADYEAGLATPVKWHYYEEAPADLTKWDIVEAGLMDFYGGLFCGMDVSEGEYLAELEDFLTEFRELADAIIADIEKLYLTGKKQLQPLPVKGHKPLKDIASLPLEDWSSTVFSWGDLYKLDVYGFKEEAEEDTAIFDGNRRAINGIAILRASDLLDRSPRINERGYYVEPDIMHALSNFALETFFPEAEDYADNLEIVETARQTLIESYYHLKGYNLSLELIARYYDVPDMTVFQMDIAGIEDKIRAFNELVPILYKKITETDYADGELKAKKLQVLKDLFQPIDYEALTIPEEKKEAAQQLLVDFKAFQPENSGRFNSLLCVLPEGAAESEGGEGAY